MAEHDNHKKPLGVMLLVIFSFALGFSVIALAAIAAAQDSDVMAWVSPPMADLDWIPILGISGIFGAAFFANGVGIWRLRGMSKSVLQALSIFALVLYPLRLGIVVSSVADNKWIFRTSDMVGLTVTLIGIPLSIVILLYLSRQKIILAFEAQEMVLTKRKIRALEQRIELGRERCNAGEITKAELSKLRSDCIAEERKLRARIRHLEKLRLGRERKIKERAEKKEKAREEKEEEREEKREQRKEKRAEKEERKAEKEDDEREAKKGKVKEKTGGKKGEEKKAGKKPKEKKAGESEEVEEGDEKAEHTED